MESEGLPLGTKGPYDSIRVWLGAVRKYRLIVMSCHLVFFDRNVIVVGDSILSEMKSRK